MGILQEHIPFKLSRKTILALAIIAVAIGVVILLASSRSKGDAEPIKVEARIKLNELITNDMSQIEELGGMDRKIEAYLRKWWMKGASLAIMRNDSLLYAKGYGWADEEKELRMEPGNILRMASVSKLITAAGIMVLQDKGMLSIKDTVFGPTGILNDTIYKFRDRNYKKITVEHLLRHQAGFRRDPLFSSRDVMHQLKLDHAPSAEDYIGLVMRQSLRFKPGSWQKYSNFGYLLLSRIIEKVSGMPYEKFIQKEVLQKAGCYDMHIAGIYYEDKRKNEVRYYTNEGEGKYIEEYNRSGRTVERCYGGNDINLLKGAGAWVCSAAELALLVASIDGKPGLEDILLPESVEDMIWCRRKEDYAIGWNETNPKKGWIRTGTLAGTNAVIKYFPDGECWIFLSNTSTWKGPNHFRYTSQLFDKLRRDYSGKIPSRNLFEI